MMWVVKNSLSEWSNLHFCDVLYFSEDEKLKFSFLQLSCHPHSHEGFFDWDEKVIFLREKEN